MKWLSIKCLLLTCLFVYCLSQEEATGPSTEPYDEVYDELTTQIVDEESLVYIAEIIDEAEEKEEEPSVVLPRFHLSDLTATPTGDAVKVLNFQPDNIPTVDSVASLILDGKKEPLTSLSFCVWFLIHYFKPTGTTYVFSYATSSKEDNEFNFGIYPRFYSIAVKNKYISFHVKDQLWPNNWYHSCITAHSGGEVNAYLNGKQIDNPKPSETFEIWRNGSLVLGQETDDFGRGFSALQSFSGKMTDFNLYSWILTADEISNLYNCSNHHVKGDLINWDMLPQMVKKGVHMEYEERKNICNSERSKFQAMFQPEALPSALEMCASLFRSKLYYPTSDEENQALYKATIDMVEECKSDFHSNGYFWIGVKEENDQFVNFNMQPVNYTNFQDTENKKQQKCTVMEKYPFPGRWDDTTCGKHAVCFACVDNRNVEFTLRGICTVSVIDSWFILDKFNNSDMFYFRGLTRFEITLDEHDGQTWTLRDIYNNETMASYKSTDGSYPIGTKEWKVKRKYTSCAQPSKLIRKRGYSAKENDLLTEVDHIVTLSSCKSNEYTCHTGSCIPLKNRCDMIVHCPDSSDEKKCEKLNRGDEYLRDLPPPDGEEDYLGLNLTAVVHGISMVNHKDMSLTLEITFYTAWKDLRLKFNNLNSIELLNFMDAATVWLPAVEYSNADFHQLHRAPTILTAKRSSKPEKDDYIRPERDELFLGSKIPLHLNQKVKAPFYCHMDLADFPFDIQKCYVKLKELNGELLVRWNTVNVSYAGELLLTEFKVGEFKSRIISTQNYSVAEIEVTLKRRFDYYIISMYMPTLMLIVICYSSLFCKIESIDLRVMMTITILIVLYTLYQQISDSLPKTSYTKAIDVWCLFAISYIFALIVFHVILEREFEILGSITAKFRSQENIDEIRYKSDMKHFMLRFSRVAFVAIFFIFCLCHFPFFRWTELLSD